MSIKTLIIGAAAAGIALGSLGLATGEASAATMAKKPIQHHGLVCKAGYGRHHVKWHGKWGWRCVKVRSHRHHHHHHHTGKPIAKPAPKKP